PRITEARYLRKAGGASCAHGPPQAETAASPWRMVASMSQLTGDEYLDRPFRAAAERIRGGAWGCRVHMDGGGAIGSPDEFKPNGRRCSVLAGPAAGPATVIVKRILGPGAYDPDDLRRVPEFDGMPTRAWQLCHE